VIGISRQPSAGLPTSQHRRGATLIVTRVRCSDRRSSNEADLRELDEAICVQARERDVIIVF